MKEIDRNVVKLKFSRREAGEGGQPASSTAASTLGGSSLAYVDAPARPHCKVCILKGAGCGVMPAAECLGPVVP